MNFSRRLQKLASVFYTRRNRKLVRTTVLVLVFLFTLSVLFLLFIFSIAAFNINFIYFMFIMKIFTFAACFCLYIFARYGDKAFCKFRR